MVSIASLAFGALEQTAHAQMTSRYAHSQYNTRMGTTQSSGTPTVPSSTTPNSQQSSPYAYSHNGTPTVPSSTTPNSQQSSPYAYSHNGTRTMPSFTYQNSSQSSGYVYQQRYNSTMTSQGPPYGQTSGRYKLIL